MSFCRKNRKDADLPCALKEPIPASDLKTKPGNWTAGKLFGMLFKTTPLRSGVQTMWERETEAEFTSPAAKKALASSTSPGPSATSTTPTPSEGAKPPSVKIP